MLQEIQPGLVRQAQIEQDRLEGSSRGQAKTLGRGPGKLDVKSLSAEKAGQASHHLRLIVDPEQPVSSHARDFAALRSRLEIRVPFRHAASGLD
jgi:hypothetical protein